MRNVRWVLFSLLFLLLEVRAKYMLLPSLFGKSHTSQDSSASSTKKKYGLIPSLFQNRNSNNKSRGKLDISVFEKPANSSPNEKENQPEEEASLPGEAAADKPTPTKGKLDLGGWSPRPVPQDSNNDESQEEPEQSSPETAASEEEDSTPSSSSTSVSKGKLNIDIAPIVGGGPATAGEFPFFVHGTDPLCGGTLVHADIVLTSAQCQASFAVGKTVFVGSIDPGSGTESYTVESIRPHPMFGGDNGGALANDIMLVQLSGLSSSEVVVLNTDPLAPADDETVRIIGFGLTADGGTSSPSLYKVDITNVDFVACTLTQDPPLFPDQQLCAGDLAGGKDACDGDEGGPMLNVAGGIQYGITSHSDGACAEANNPGLYTKVSAYTEWIEEGICDLSADRPDTCPSLAPSDTPSMVPTSSAAPTTSRAPSAAPSISLAPSVGPTLAPTPEPTKSSKSSKSGKKSKSSKSGKKSKSSKSGKKSSKSGKGGKGGSAKIASGGKKGSSSDEEKETDQPTPSPTTSAAPSISLAPSISNPPSMEPTSSSPPSLAPTQAAAAAAARREAARRQRRRQRRRRPRNSM